MHLNRNTSLIQKLLKLQIHSQEHGVYHKTLLHFHTPASHDYKLINSKNNKLFSSYDESDVIGISEKRHLFRGKITKKYLENMASSNELFDDLKELLGYLMIADTLFRKSVEMAIITDHNSIMGFKKLQDAVNILFKVYNNVQKPHIQMGIEISCGDSLHVVGIFENNDKSSYQINDFLKNELVSQKMGTYLPSWSVIERFRKMGAISYVAHFNTANVFKDKFDHSGAYKEKLLSYENIGLVGLSNLGKSEGLRGKLKRDRSIDDVTILYDEDSHDLNHLGEKIFWLKGQELNFNMILNAVHDADISIQYNVPKLPSTYVQGIYINGHGFLGKEEIFNASFSTALNCIIGGRGSGKSTLLDCISLVLSQQVRNIDELKNVCNQGNIILSVVFQGKEYYVVFNPATGNSDGEDDSFVRRYLYGAEHQYQYGAYVETHPDLMELRNKTIEKIQIFTILGDTVNELVNKRDFLRAIFKSAYSVNELVKYATDDRITQFIMGQLSNSNKLIRGISKLNIGDDRALENANTNMEAKLLSRKKKMLSVLEPFSKDFENIRLEYNQVPIEGFEFNWESLIDPAVFKGKKRWFKNYNIDVIGVASYLDDITQILNPFGVYLLFKDRNWEELEKNNSILNYTQELTSGDISNGAQRIVQTNRDNVLEAILNTIIRPAKMLIYRFIDDYYSQVDIFDLKFDINSYEHKDAGRLFKSIKQLSLGQKVVALLDFIFIFGEITGDETPLLLDQPEDNLDSSYIYKHLVTSLRREKDKRQVIIVTHNSTIVTNSKPEEIIALQSDNRHGWISNSGYPTERQVIMDILNLLEGGVDSFKHKEFIYDPVITESKDR